MNIRPASVSSTFLALFATASFAQSPPYSVTPVLFVPTPSSFPAGYQPTPAQLSADMANITVAMDRVRVWFGGALGRDTSLKIQPAVQLSALGGLSTYGIVWTNPAARYADGITLDSGTSTWGSITNEVRNRGYSPGTSSSPRIIVIFCKGAGGFAGGAQWFSANGGGMCLLGDWCLDSLANRVPPPNWSWWTGVDRQTAAAGHELGHTIGLPHPDIANPVTGEQDWAYSLMGWWWDWPQYPVNPAQPSWPLTGLHAWASNSGPSGAVLGYQDEFLLAHRSNWFMTSVVDPDGDGLPDSWELEQFGNLTHTAGVDEEPDGLTNLEEFQNGTDPLDADSDDDGLLDGVEVKTSLTDPLDPDSDDDDLDDGAEVAAGTDPNDPDSDDDVMPDGWEVAHGLNPLVDDGSGDLDNDDSSNFEEYTAGSDPQAPWSIPVVSGFALDFDGTNDFVNFGNVAVPGNRLTIEAWVKPRSAGSARILEKLEDYGVQFTSSNVVRFITRQGFSWDILDGATPNAADQWVHIACVLDGAQKRIFLNGEPDGQQPYTYDVRVSSNPLIVGASSPVATQGFLNGAIDEIRIWNVARSQAEIFANLDTALLGTEPGLVGYWRLDDGMGQIASDSAGSHPGQLGQTSGSEASDPAWIPSAQAPARGPHIDEPSFSPVTSSASATVVTVTLSDADSGGQGVAAARLYYGYDWPFSTSVVVGEGPGGAGDGTWVFTIPPQGAAREGQALSFFLRAADTMGHTSFDTAGQGFHTVEVRAPGDWDGDGDVDLIDYAGFANCLHGPGAGLAMPECNLVDLDADLDVDLDDFASLQRVWTAARAD